MRYAIVFLLLSGCAIDIPSQGLPVDDPGYSDALQAADDETYQPELPDCMEHAGAVAAEAEPSEVYYYVTSHCPICVRMQKDVAGSKVFKFVKATPDAWSKARNNQGFPMLRWKVNGKWDGEQHGWTNLNDFVRRFDRTQSSAVAGQVSLHLAKVSRSRVVVERVRQLDPPDDRGARRPVRSVVVTKSYLARSSIAALRRTRKADRLESRRQTVESPGVVRGFFGWMFGRKPAASSRPVRTRARGCPTC